MSNLSDKKKAIAKKMKPEKGSWREVGEKFLEQGKGLKKGMPAEYYKHISWNK